MNNEFNEKVGDFYKTVSKPLADLAALNINTVTKLAQNPESKEIFEEIARAKKPEEYISAQIKLTQIAATEGMQYIQQACDIWLDALSQSGEVMKKNTREVREAGFKAATGNTERPSKL
jgi:hypothetical protein